MKAGLVSISFRGLGAEEIIDMARACGLEGIEWGGDVHVPCGDIQRARQVGERTRAAGLQVACYGSYCRMSGLADGELKRVAETAEALGAPLIRVWAGPCGSAEATPEVRGEVCENTRRLARMAKNAGMEVAFEYHGGTLTDTSESAVALLKEIDRTNVGCLWQPPVGMSTEGCLNGIAEAARYIRNIHVFSWTGTRPIVRLPLEVGKEKWRKCLEAIEKLPGDRWLLLEFVCDDSPEQLMMDAQCLRRWMEGRWNE